MLEVVGVHCLWEIALVEIAAPSGDRVHTNPLSRDSVLFDMYLSALDLVLDEPEILSAFDDFELSGGALRMKMVSEAARVLSAAPQEYAAYRAVADGELGISRAAPSQTPAFRDAGLVFRWLGAGAATVGVLMMVGGGASWGLWPAARGLVWAGAAVVVAAAVTWMAPRVLGGASFSYRLARGDGSQALITARDRLVAAVSEIELLAQARTFINAGRRDRFGHDYVVTRSEGLSEVYNSSNKVSTRVAERLSELLGRFNGASIGIAGPRGPGKSTLIREYTESTSYGSEYYYDDFGWRWLTGSRLPRRVPQDLRCLVSAPVNYAARDFVLHLFATFCRAVIDGYGRKPGEIPVLILAAFWVRGVINLAVSLFWRTLFYGGLATALLYWQHPIARHVFVPSAWVKYAAFAVLCIGTLSFLRAAVAETRFRVRNFRGGGDQTLADAARSHLSRVRFLQTYTRGWSGALSLPAVSAQGQYSKGVSQAEQPLSYPEIVDEFRHFARTIAAEVHRRGRRVFIGVDELDKIGSAEQAEQFLNEIKGVFGIPYLYFMVSVSDDALTAFERRGLPLRDAFDSSFDEIIDVGRLAYAESRRLLYRRVIGLTEPYVALCHCLAGGLPRDLIRAGRLVVSTAERLTATASFVPDLLSEDASIDASMSYTQLRSRPELTPPTLAGIAAAIVHDEINRKLEAIRHAATTTTEDAAELQGTLFDITAQLTAGQPLINIVDAVAAADSDEAPAIASLRLDFAAFTYYCATLQDVFTDRLDHESMIRATAEIPGPGTFDALAGTRNAFALGTPLAWRLITKFRDAWSLETRDIRKITPKATRLIGVIGVIEDQITAIRTDNARYAGDHRSIILEINTETNTRVSLELALC